MVNNITLEGNLTKDPDYKTVGQDNSPVCRYRVACHRDYRDSSGDSPVDYFLIEAWGKPANFASEHFKKGMRVIITGRLQTDTYESNGETRTSHYIRVEKQYFGQKKAGEGSQKQEKPNNSSGFEDFDGDFSDF